MSQPLEASVSARFPAGCKICQDIWRRFADPHSTHQVNFGSPEQALSTSCPVHKPLVQRFIDEALGDADEADGGRPKSRDMGIEGGPRDKGRAISLVESLSGLGRYWNLLLVKKEADAAHPGTGRILDPCWVDIDVVLKWKKACLSSHAAKCGNPMKIWPVRPAWLIDVERRCLVPGQQTTGEFVALSYVHGQHTWPVVDADILSRLREPFALDEPGFSERMAPIARHAIYLTSKIGERYLWVDALCIIHDDRNRGALAGQLKAMSAIYANAFVTIIAADGDSQNGLAGLKGISSPRPSGQRIVPFGDEQLLVRKTGYFLMEFFRPYDQRGWTYQEYKMAKRKILFVDGELHWECCHSVWHEEMIHGCDPDSYIDPSLGTVLAGFPDLGSLNRILTCYNERELRFDEDCLPAISGLLSVLSRSFTGGFLNGIPEMFFDRGLGWRPHWKHSNLRRRTFSDRPIGTRLSPSGLPSWSWIGWQGLIFHGYGEAARVRRRSHWAEETVPITEWYTSDCPVSLPSQRRRIRSTWFENRDSYKDTTKPLPPGWTRHDAPGDADILYPDGCGRFIFSHASMEDSDEEEECEWFYPFHVSDIRESTPPFTPEQTQYLFCETLRIHLWGHQSGDENMVTVCNDSGSDVGTLHLHDTQSLALFPEAVAEGEKGLPVELVALYKSTLYHKTWHDAEADYGLPRQKREQYAVLWIEWREGVAYRLASGDVRAEEWDKLDSQKVSLVLG
ncbi:hypothetical protein CDD83_9159 [Cordyceps sp. RAO-2017]|nr:hypothetical protein CDD83_9159 [Cordyceps sp. RAO-2017]